MGKYIDKAALVAEIKNRRDSFYSLSKSCEKGTPSKAGFYAQAQTLEGIKNFIDTLEVKEVNFKDVKSIFEGQYLSKDKVVTTIERLQDECEEQGDNNGVELLEKLFNKLDTLEVKDESFKPMDSDFERDAVSFCIDNGLNTTPYIAKTIAKHFFELGIQQSNHFIDWQRNIDINKPPKNHSILMQTTHGIAEGEWNGEKWIQYRWNSSLKDEDVLAWIELSNLVQKEE